MSRVYRFGECELDENQCTLRRGGEQVRLEPRTFDVLLHLVRNRDRVVSKQELLDTLWPGTFVSESVLPTQIAALRKALGDSRGEQRLIQTLYARGYRFVADVFDERAVDPLPSRVPEPAPPLAPRWTSGVLPFVGRASLLSRLREAAAQARAGKRRIVVLTGEAGIGKSRLAGVWLEAERACMRTVAARADRELGEPTYDVFRQLLRGLVRDMGDRGEALLGADRVHLGALVGEPADTTSADLSPPERARSRLFSAVARVFERTCRERPLALVIDDLQDMDRPSWLLLRFVARELASRPLAIVATCRVPDPDSTLAAHLAALNREPGFERVELRSLELEDVAAVVQAIPGFERRPELASTLHELTEGHPLFLGEVVRWLASEPGLDPATLSPLRLPAGLREAIGLRLATTSPECRAVLVRAAVVGREFDLALLRGEDDPGEAGLLDLIDEATSARLVEPAQTGPGRMRFAHALFREVLYADLPLAARTREHRRLVDTLLPRVRDDADPRLLECAHHARLGAPGGGAERALVLVRRAASHCINATAYEDAAEWLEQGRVLSETSGGATPATRCELLIELGDAYSRMAKRSLARRAYREAADLAREADRPDLFGLAAVGYGMRSEWGGPRDDALVALLEEALSRLGDEAPSIRARVWARLSGTEAYWSKPERCRAAADEALRLAERSGSVEALVAARRSVCFSREAIHAPIGDALAGARELLRFGERLLAEGHELLGKDVQISAHQAFYNTHMIAGEAAAATPHLVHLETLTGELHEPMDLWILSWHHFGRAVAGARFDEAERLLVQSRELATQIEVPAAVGLPRLMELYLNLERGGPPLRALGLPAAMLDRLARTAEATPEYAWPIRCMALLYALEMGLEEEARVQFEALAARGFEDLPRDAYWLLCAALLAWVCADLVDRERAARLRDLLRPYAERTALGTATRIVLGPTRYFVARLGQVLGEREEARSNYEAAIERCQRLGARTCELRAAFGLASLDLGAGSAARASALARLGELARETRAVGMEGLAERCLSLRDA